MKAAKGLEQELVHIKVQCHFGNCNATLITWYSCALTKIQKALEIINTTESYLKLHPFADLLQVAMPERQ